MVCQIEQMLGELVRRHLPQQRMAYLQVDLRTGLFGNEAVRRLLDSVVQKPIGVALRKDETGADSLGQGRVQLSLASLREPGPGFQPRRHCPGKRALSGLLARLQ